MRKPWLAPSTTQRCTVSQRKSSGSMAISLRCSTRGSELRRRKLSSSAVRLGEVRHIVTCKAFDCDEPKLLTIFRTHLHRLRGIRPGSDAALLLEGAIRTFLRHRHSRRAVPSAYVRSQADRKVRIPDQEATHYALLYVRCQQSALRLLR